MLLVIMRNQITEITARFIDRLIDPFLDKMLKIRSSVHETTIDKQLAELQQTIVTKLESAFLIQ